jgi:hypothetical protein
MPSRLRERIGPVRIKEEFTAGKIALVTMGSVIRNIAFEENHLMSSVNQRAAQCSPESRVAITPRGTHRQSEYHEFHNDREIFLRLPTRFSPSKAF